MPNSKKVWFITCASSGFGRAFVDYALGRGHRVVATAISTDRLNDLAAKAPDRVLILALDVTRPADAEAAIAGALSRFGRIDVLINTAAYGATTAPESETEPRALMETSFFGTMAVTRAALPTFRAQRFGAIVNISGICDQTFMSAFGAAGNFALEGASEALAQEMAPFGVRVLIVEPGEFRTELAAREGQSARVGDPAKAAAAIETALEADVTPLRLALGGDAVDAIRHHAQALLADLAKWEPISRAMGF
jgi:NAD(P)-dependent dehydrogenase (short-subunit alcohol dehydrogenase family)